MKKIVILKTDERTICKQQDKECRGINCKNCQFNKQGLEEDKLIFRLRKLYIYWLHKLKKLPDDVKATSLASETVSYLLDEEKYQKVLGETYCGEKEIE